MIVTNYAGPDKNEPAPANTSVFDMSTARTRTLEPADIAWCLAVQNALQRRLTFRHRLAVVDAADATSAVIERFLSRISEMRTAYPEPRTFAAAVARGAAEDHRRRQRAQRGERARLVTGTDQMQRPAREVISLDLSHHDGSDDVDPADRAVTLDHLERTLSRIPPFDRMLLQQVHADGCTVTAVAARHGMSRSQLSRRLTATIATLRAQAA